MLDKYNDFSVHQVNLQTVMKEICKSINQNSPPVMNLLIVIRENAFSICNYQVLSSNDRGTVRYGLPTILYSLFFMWRNSSLKLISKNP